MQQLEKTENTIICKSQTCRYKKDCAQHDSAGDFRSENGFTPEIHVMPEYGPDSESAYLCDQILDNDKCGMWVFRKGRLVNSNLNREQL